MCGGLARWLRMLGVDASYTAGIDDAALVAHALRESRIVISSDGPLFERRPFQTGDVRGLRLPVGLPLPEQVRRAVVELAIARGFPRCTACNGELHRVTRAQVADVVPARSLLMTRAFYRCEACGHVYWEGTHWRRVAAAQARIVSNPPRGT